MDDVGLKFWHGGSFQSGPNGLQYVGGEAKTINVDPDLLCWFWLKELAQECGQYSTIDEIHYLLPENSLDEGLRRVYEDKEVLQMAEIAIKYHCVELFVVHGIDIPPNIDVEPPTMIDTVHNTLHDSAQTPITSPPKNNARRRKKITAKDNACFERRTSPRNRKKTSPSTQPQVQQHSTQPASSLFVDENESAQQHSTQPASSLLVDENASAQQQSTQPGSPLPVDENVSTQQYSNQYETPSEDDPGTSSEDDPVYDPASEDEESEESEESYFENENVDDEFRNDEQENENVDDEFRNDDGEQNACDGEGDTSDDELIIARDQARGMNARLRSIVNKLQMEAAQGKLGCQGKEAGTSRVDDNAYVSEYENSEDEVHTPHDSDEDEGIIARKRRLKNIVVNDKTDWSTFQWRVGQRFPIRREFRAAVANFAVAQGRNLTFKVSDKSRLQRLGVKCKPGCPFRLYASLDNRLAAFVVKSVDSDHNCHRTMEENRQLKSTWLAEQLLEVFKARPHWPASEIIETVRRAYRVVIRRDKAYKVKYWAHKKLHGSMTEHYHKLGRYMEALRQSSPCSVLRLEHKMIKQITIPIFDRLFVCFEGLKRGFLDGCRRVICVDGCFLKTFLGGMLLAAIGRDANDQMFPLAWAVVVGENNDSWEWFFRELQSCLVEGTGAGWAILSDEHTGILNAVAKLLPEAEHRHCARHIFANWHKTHKGDEMKLLFWKAAWAYNVADYNDALEKMEEVSSAAVIDFKAANPSCFCRAFLRTETKCDVNVSNLAETFNGYIIQARTKHIIYMLEEIRSALMRRLVQKRQAMSKSNARLCPRIQIKLDKDKEEAANCVVMPSTDHLFQVSHKMDSLMVNLEEKTCTCRKWNLCGIPCCHAIACIFFMHMEAEPFVDECYSRDAYLRAYSGSIPPCEGERHWPRIDTPLQPPPIKIGPGRPRKNRRKDPHENPKKKGRLTAHGRMLTCSVCKSNEHTKRKCPDKFKQNEAQPKRSRGRPRKNDSGGASQCQSSEANQSQVTAEPARTGRGGRVIRGGRRSRGGKQSSGGRGVRGAFMRLRGDAVYIRSDGRQLRTISSMQVEDQFVLPTQGSCS